MNPHRASRFAGPLLLALGALALGQSKDPFVGTWLLSRGKSDFNPPSNFFKRTMIMEPAPNGFKCTIRTVSDRQQTFESSYTAQYDNKDVPIDESRLDTVSLKRIDQSTIERTGKIKGQVVETAVMRISDGGKALTVETKGSIDGQDYTSTEVFNRQ
jgi:hypothetical protein